MSKTSTIVSLMTAYCAQAQHAEEWAQGVIEKLEAEGFKETAPGSGMFERSDVTVAP